MGDEKILKIDKLMRGSFSYPFLILLFFSHLFHSAMVAKKLADDSFALVFGINTLIALLFQTIMTVVIVSETGLKLDPKGQFMVFGAYFIVLSVLFLIASIIQTVFCRRHVDDITID